MAFFLLIIGAYGINNNEKNTDFYFLEENTLNNSQFVSNGIRMNYISKEEVQDELLIIKDNLTGYLGENIKIEDNIISYKDKDKEITAIVWKDKIDTKVQITYVNNRRTANTIQLKKEIEQIQNIAAENIKYFKFVKVKIIEEQKQNILDVLSSRMEKDTLEELDINNGIIAKAILKDGEKINFAFTYHDSNEYLILGTPVIFVTY